MNNFSFSSSIDKELSNEKRMAVSLGNFRGELEGIALEAKKLSPSKDLKVIDEDTIIIFVDQTRDGKIPSARKLFFLLCKLLKEIFCPECI